MSAFWVKGMESGIGPSWTVKLFGVCSVTMVDEVIIIT